MAHVPVSRTIAKRFGGEANLRMAVSKAVSGLTLTSVISQLHLCFIAHSFALVFLLDFHSVVLKLTIELLALINS